MPTWKSNRNYRKPMRNLRNIERSVILAKRNKINMITILTSISFKIMKRASNNTTKLQGIRKLAIRKLVTARLKS